MKRVFWLIILVILGSCGRRVEPDGKVITVSIAPFKYFVEGIAGKKFNVNVMVPPGANPHIYEPFPDQVSRLRKSVAYISNGFLGFEMTWLDRFYEVNPGMKRLSLGESIEIIKPTHQDNDGHVENGDPHYWVSPLCALKIAASIKDFLINIEPSGKAEFEDNYNSLIAKINEVDLKARELSTRNGSKDFIIYHPNLGYLARDYGLEEIAVENEGKEPSPARLIQIIDRAKTEGIKMIMVQREYDPKNAMEVARETNSRLVVIDPLSEDWYTSTNYIISILNESFDRNKN